ncbi:hypothetical protein BD560DRAFT_444302 [Blakeslea trispora]|nr:hypothetical protein BD560DRAFT_444302 [Blakeslea trispora]
MHIYEFNLLIPLSLSFSLSPSFFLSLSLFLQFTFLLIFSFKRLNMGQNVSQHEQSQSDGSTIFGYTSLVPPLPTSNCIDHEEQDVLQDNLLSKPLLYGLENSSVSTFTYELDQGGSRADSGLFLLNGKTQLWKDLIYVDQTYYSQQKKRLNVVQERKASQFESALTFRDVLDMNLDNIQEIDLTNRGFKSIEHSIGLLPMIRKLDLSHNYLKEIPDAIGYLRQLEVLSISHNQIRSLPDTICHLSKLIELNLSNNQIRSLTPFIHHLECLQTLNLSYNFLEELTYSVEGLQSLVSLDLSFNPITALPAEITHLPHLRRLLFEGCRFATSLTNPISLLHNPPSLLEICARYIVKNETVFISSISKVKTPKINKRKVSDYSMTAEHLKKLMPNHLYQYLHNSKPCSHCRGPYFDALVIRGRWIERNDIWIPLEYRLCSAHWSNDLDRLHAMFSSTTHSVAPKAASMFKLSKPQLTNLNSVSLSIPARSRSYFFHKPIVRRSSIAAPPQVPDDRRCQQEQNQEHQPDSIPGNSSGSAVKRWKFKVHSASAILLSRQFPPLHSRVDSPSDVLNIVGYPFTVKNKPVTPDHVILSNEKPEYQLAVRNIASPVTVYLPPIEDQNQIKVTAVTEADSQHALLLNTSREEKTLVEIAIPGEPELDRLHQKILEFEHEREIWHQKLQGYIDREEQMKRVIHQNQIRIYQLQQDQKLIRRRSSQTQSTHSSRLPDSIEHEEEDDSNNEGDDSGDQESYQSHIELCPSYRDDNSHHSVQVHPHYHRNHYRKKYQHACDYIVPAYPFWHPWQQYHLPYHQEQNLCYHS